MSPSTRRNIRRWVGRAVRSDEGTAGGGAGSYHGETGAAENDGELHGEAAEPAGTGGLF